MFPWCKERERRCLGMFWVCRWCPLGMPRMAQGTRWGSNSCLWLPPAPLSPSRHDGHLQAVPSIHKAPPRHLPAHGSAPPGQSHARNQTTIVPTRAWNAYEQLTSVGGRPYTARDLKAWASQTWGGTPAAWRQLFPPEKKSGDTSDIWTYLGFTKAFQRIFTAWEEASKEKHLDVFLIYLKSR